METLGVFLLFTNEQLDQIDQIEQNAWRNHSIGPWGYERIDYTPIEVQLVAEIQSLCEEGY